jgi:hypothetical protein
MMLARIFSFCVLYLFAASAYAEIYECSGFEPTFTMTLGKQEIVLNDEGETGMQTQRLSPVAWSQANRTGLSVYRVVQKNKPDFVAILNKEKCASEIDGNYTHHIYYSSGQNIVDGCCKLKEK